MILFSISLSKLFLSLNKKDESSLQYDVLTDQVFLLLWVLFVSGGLIEQLSGRLQLMDQTKRPVTTSAKERPSVARSLRYVYTFFCSSFNWGGEEAY